jgi:GNAT superfamily N-acetyltransferase
MCCNRLTVSKISYRLRQSSGLNIGLFTTVKPSDERSSLPTYATARTTETGSDRRSVLLAHIFATLTDNERVLVEDSTVPPNWDSTAPNTPQNIGHKPGGSTVALHYLSVLPEFQRHQIGSTLLRTFIQMIKDAKIVDRIALCTIEKLIPWYEKFGFEHIGKSEASFGGWELFDMVSLILFRSRRGS